MHQYFLLFVLSVSFLSTTMSQKVIPLPSSSIENIEWYTPERRFISTSWNTEVITNVSQADMTMYLPDVTLNLGTAIVICPGGGMYGLSITKEGIEVAEWLQKRGIAAFVLKYRLVPTGEDGTVEITDNWEIDVNKKARQLLPYAKADAQNAIRYIRDNASALSINPDQIGIMGFSAGGAVTMEVAFSSDLTTMANFIAPIYPWMDIVDYKEPSSYSQPLFVACASDDPLELAPASIKLYNDWNHKGKQAELHIYAKGGHGFGMDKQGLPSDNWIEDLGDWLKMNGWMK